MVECIQSFHAHFKIHAFGDLRRLHQADVGVEELRTRTRTASGKAIPACCTARSPTCSPLDRAGVEQVCREIIDRASLLGLVHSQLALQSAGCYSVKDHAGIAVVGRAAEPAGDVNRRSGLPAGNRINLPSADEPVHHTVAGVQPFASRTKRQRPDRLAFDGVAGCRKAPGLCRIPGCGEL